MITYGVHEILRHYQGTKQFPRHQCLRMETPGWRVLDFEGNHMRGEEVDWQREVILRAPQVAKDREYPFSENLIVDSSGSVDVSLPVLAKVSALVEALRLGLSYELVHQLWSQFTSIAGQVNVDVPWSRIEVLVSDFCHSMRDHPVCSLFLLLVNPPEWHVPAHFEQSVHSGKDARLLRHRVCGAGQAHLSVHSVLGQKPLSSGLRINSGSVQQQRERGGGCAGTDA